MYFFLFKVFNKKQWKCNCFLNKGNCRFLIFYKDIECKLFCIIWIIIKNKYLVCRLVVVNLRRPNWVIAVHCQCPLKLLAWLCSPPQQQDCLRCLQQSVLWLSYCELYQAKKKILNFFCAWRKYNLALGPILMTMDPLCGK